MTDTAPVVQLTRLRAHGFHATHLLADWCVLPDEDAGGLPVLDGYVPLDDEEVEQELRRAHAVALAEVVRWLDAIHGRRGEPGYWELVVYRFLTVALSEFYFRYQYLRHALGSLPGARALTLAENDWTTPATEGETVSLLFGSDRYNLQLLSQAARGLKGEAIPVPASALEEAEADRAPARSREAGWRARLAAELRNRLRRPAPATGPGSIVLLSTHFPRGVEVALAATPGLRLSRLAYPAVVFPSGRVDPARRAVLRVPDGASAFERAFLESLRTNVPRDLVEDFHRYHRVARRVVRRGRPAVIAAAFLRDVSHRVWAAECRTGPAPSRLVLVQHGGSFGEGNFARNLWAEAEARVSDVFASWGWGEGEPGIRPLPAPRLMEVPGEAGPPLSPAAGDLAGDEVLVVSNRLRYFVVPERFFGATPAPDAQERFFRHLDPALLPRVHYRAHPRDGGTLEEQVPWHPRFPQVVLAPLEVPIERQCRQARLVVVNYLFSTTFLQCMAMDVPVVLVVDGGIPFLHSRARALYRALQEVGVVHTRAEEAAVLVSSIHADVTEWWREPARRAAVDAFRHAFARSGGDAVEQWRGFLREQAALAVPSGPRS